MLVYSGTCQRIGSGGYSPNRRPCYIEQDITRLNDYMIKFPGFISIDKRKTIRFKA